MSVGDPPQLAQSRRWPVSRRDSFFSAAPRWRPHWPIEQYHCGHGTVEAPLGARSRILSRVTMVTAIAVAASASPAPLARPNRERHLSHGAASPRACLKRQYRVANWINAGVAGLKGVHSPNVGGANFGFTLDTFPCGAISRSVAPRPFGRILGPRSPAAHFRRKQIPDFVDPAQHTCEFGLHARQSLAQFKEFVVFLCHGWHALAVPFVVHLRELLPAVGQAKPKCPILSPRPLGEFSARLCLLSIHVGGVPCRRLAFLRMRHAARRTFESA
jgi:hypothetical protein